MWTRTTPREKFRRKKSPLETRLAVRNPATDLASVNRLQAGRAALDWTAGGGCPYMALVECLLAGQQEDWILRGRLAVGWGNPCSKRSREIRNQCVGHIAAESNGISGGIDNSDRSSVTDAHVDPAAIRGGRG